MLNVMSMYMKIDNLFLKNQSLMGFCVLDTDHIVCVSQHYCFMVPEMTVFSLGRNAMKIPMNSSISHVSSPWKRRCASVTIGEH